jgi:hypothetical protein
MDWIDLAQDRDQWSALVNKVMNLRVIPTPLEILLNDRMKKMGRTYSTQGRSAYKMLVVNPEEQRPIGIHKYRWENNIRTDHEERG